jgi:hypothetical protein
MSNLLQNSKFLENLQCMATFFFAEVLRKIVWPEVMLCSDRAADCIVDAANIRAPAGDR